MSLDPAWQPRPVWDGAGVSALAALDDSELAAALRGSAMERARVSGLRRNIQVAAGNLKNSGS